MPVGQRNIVGGIVSLKMDGVVLNAVGNFDYNLGLPKREAAVGSDRVHGYFEKPQVPMIEGEVRDNGGLDLRKFLDAQDVTLTLALKNGKTFVLRNAWQAGEGTVKSESGEITCRWEGVSADEV